MWKAYSSINNSDGAPNQTAKIALAKAEKAINTVLNKVNTFFKNDWKVYQSKIESTEHSLFKEYLPIKLE